MQGELKIFHAQIVPLVLPKFSRFEGGKRRVLCDDDGVAELGGRQALSPDSNAHSTERHGFWDVLVASEAAKGGCELLWE